MATSLQQSSSSSPPPTYKEVEKNRDPSDQQVTPPAYLGPQYSIPQQLQQQQVQCVVRFTLLLPTVAS